MKLLRCVRQNLQDKLSLSCKMFIREFLAAFVRPFARIAGRIQSHRRVPAFGTVPTPPQLKLNDLRPGTAAVVNQRAKKANAVDSIRTSIIIPVFNKAAFTFQCLQSLLQEIDFGENEVIVVDNASSDETEVVLAHFGNVVRTIRNQENRGFVDASNQGAAAARGEYLLFLNNDTQVLPGWLQGLVETIATNPAIGAVGSMFLYPDGSIQEAGAIVWKNGEAHHYGWGGSPDDPRFNFAREVDYCSAASLLIKREIFERLGGFDRRFAPAYYEDIDLCFGVRSLGYKVIYQPASRLIHFEGTTAGSDTTKGFKQYQIINRRRFVEKWRDVLDREQLSQNVSQVEEASDRSRDRPRVLVFDERIPSPDRDAGSLRMFIILKTLAEWCHVIFVPFNRPQSLDYERALWKEGIETADAVDYRRLVKHPNVVAAIVSRASMGSVFVQRIRRANAKVGIVFDTVDIHFHRLEREHEVSGDAAVRNEAERYRKLERKLAEESDLVWCASAEDKEVMLREVPESNIEVVPTIHELRDAGPPFDERQGLLFIGNLAHRPNDDAVLFFMREVYPIVHRELPGVELDIIGDNPSPAIAAFSSNEVSVRGFVHEVEPYLRSCRVFVAPLRFGAGIKGKVGEAMAYGIPVVTTSVGAEGFGATHGLDIMLADDPQSFAEAIKQLYSDRELWQRIANNSRLLIERHFTPVVIAETINQSVRQMSLLKSGAKPTFPTAS
jgi:GT2 family glycosyltransferase